MKNMHKSTYTCILVHVQVKRLLHMYFMWCFYLFQATFKNKRNDSSSSSLDWDEVDEIMAASS